MIVCYRSLTGFLKCSGFEVIQAMSKLPVDAKDRPLQLVTISHCGELQRKAKPGEPETLLLIV